jgi:hypothetical protein
MNADPPLDDFNNKLPEMADYDHTLKSRIWNLVKLHADRAGLKFDAQAKRFHHAEQVEEFF